MQMRLTWYHSSLQDALLEWERKCFSYSSHHIFIHYECHMDQWKQVLAFRSAKTSISDTANTLDREDKLICESSSFPPQAILYTYQPYARVNTRNIFCSPPQSIPSVAHPSNQAGTKTEYTFSTLQHETAMKLQRTLSHQPLKTVAPTVMLWLGSRRRKLKPPFPVQHLNSCL